MFNSFLPSKLKQPIPIGIFTIAVIVWPCATLLAQHEKSHFAHFCGVNQGDIKKHSKIWSYLTINRSNLSWSKLQPNRDKWNDNYLKHWGKSILFHRKRGVELIPILGYVPVWAGRTEPWSFVIRGKRYDVPARSTPKPAIIAIETDIETGKRRQVKFKARIPPQNIHDWEAYVEKAVRYLRKPPYKVKYFQIWNEPTDSNHAFWYGGIDQFLKTIHIPAAKIIHKYGGNVVFGGAVPTDSALEYFEAIKRNQAWELIDIFDMHYYPLVSWDNIYNLYTKEYGKFNIGLWQTEIGFSQDKTFIAITYPRFYHWSLLHNGENIDKYKLLYFAFSSPNDPKAYGYKRCLYSGNKPTVHGRAFITLSNLLNSPDIKPYNKVRCVPELRPELNENLSAIYGFDCNDRIIFSVNLRTNQNWAKGVIDWNGNREMLGFWQHGRFIMYLDRISPSSILDVKYHGIFGSSCSVPWTKDAKGSGTRIAFGYHLGNREEKEADRENGQRNFYVEIILKRPHD